MNYLIRIEKINLLSLKNNSLSNRKAQPFMDYSARIDGLLGRTTGKVVAYDPAAAAGTAAGLESQANVG